MRGKAGIVTVVIVGILALYAKLHERTGPSGNPARPDVAADAGDVERADFDFYLLAMSWHPAFCADGHQNKPECQVPQPHPLAIHGLWPEKLEAGAYPHDCRAPRLDLAPALAHELAEYMPGMQSNLHEHEWRTHGGCSGLDDDLYFEGALDRARNLDAALRRRLTSLGGRETTSAELRAAADDYHAGLGATIVFQCRTLRDAPAALRNRPFLIEIRQCVDDDGANGAPGTLLDCATVERRDQGCGRTFRIAETSR
ncbi:MAG: hypothetical protein ABI821_00175 [Pseudomonadota bacterium]